MGDLVTLYPTRIKNDKKEVGIGGHDTHLPPSIKPVNDHLVVFPQLKANLPIVQKEAMVVVPYVSIANLRAMCFELEKAIAALGMQSSGTCPQLPVFIGLRDAFSEEIKRMEDRATT